MLQPKVRLTVPVAATTRWPFLFITLTAELIGSSVATAAQSSSAGNSSSPTGERAGQIEQGGNTRQGQPTRTQSNGKNFQHAAMQTGSAAPESSSAPATRKIDTIDMSKLDLVGLQTILDGLASDDCTPAVRVSCRWKVLSLEHQRPQDAARQDAQQDAQQEAKEAIESATQSAIPAIDVTPSPADNPTTEDEAGSIREGQRFSNRVPDGFQELAQRQRTEIDIYVDNYPLVRAGISFDNSSFTFDEPVVVAKAIADLGIPDKDELETFMNGDLPVSVDDVCVDDGGPKNCVTREPLPYAFLPDLAASRVDLVVRASLLPVDKDTQNLLPPAATQLSWQASARASAAALSQQTSSADVNGGASISYGAGGLFGAGSYSSVDESARLSELYFSHQFREHYAQLGTIDHRSSGLLLNQRLLGASWSRSLNTYTDNQALFSTPVDVDLATRSIVQLVVDGVVEHSVTLDAGRRRLDTSGLPQGTYELEIRIRDAGNGLRVERQIFSRTSILPPPRKPLYGFAVASSTEPVVETTTPEPDGELFMSAFVANRFTPNLGGRFALSRYADTSAAQLELIRVGNRYQLQIEGLVGEQSALGTALRAAYRGRGMSVVVQGLRFSSDVELTGDQNLARFLRPDINQAGIAVGGQRGHYSVSLNADRVHENNDTRSRFAATLRRRLSAGAFSGSSVALQYVDDDDRREVELRFTFFAQDGDLRHGANASLTHDLDSHWEPEVGYAATFEPGSQDGFPDGRVSQYSRYERRTGRPAL